MSGAYYNEIDPYAAQWLRNLIAAGHIAPGDVDERSIEDVRPNDLRGYTQCHFFAGIGVWSYALRLAGWPDDRPIWTGSCPCQPFSAAGKGAGFADERHLWPAFYHLIKEHHEWCRRQKFIAPVIFGEQVASKDAEPWIDLVHADLEALGYAFGCVAFPSAGIGAPHIRDRNYWVAHTNNKRSQRRPGMPERADQFPVGPGGVVGRLAYNEGERCGKAGESVGRSAQWTGDSGESVWMADTDQQQRNGSWNIGQRGRIEFAECGPVNGHWRDADWLFCRDGKWRPVEPGTFPLAHGTPARVGRLRAYGNAINAQQAAEFIRAAA